MFETNSEKEFDKEQIEELSDIFQDLSDEFLDEINISIKRNASSPEIVYYSIKIYYSKLLFDAYHFKRTNSLNDRSEFIDKMCECSQKLSNFWKTLNVCLIRLKNSYFTFEDNISASPLDDSTFIDSFPSSAVNIIVSYKK